MTRRNPWYRFVQFIVREAGFRVLGGLEIRNRERIPKEGPLLVCPVHMSFLDPPVVGCMFPRMLWFMAKSELFKGLMGKVIRTTGAFPVHRGEMDSSAVRQAIDLLKQGDALLVFPEGTRNDGKTLRPIQSGVAMLAKRSDAQILPVGISGTERMLPKGASKPKRTKVVLSFGEPFRFSDLEAAGGRKGREAFAEELQTRLVSACGEAGIELKTSARKTAPTSSHPDENRSEERPPQSV
jgi:1-acyl-sn-glycerol-3-phosphate acyltransferase